MQHCTGAFIRIQAAQKAFPVTDGGAVHGFDIVIVEERLLASNTNLSGEGTSQRAGDYAVQRLTSGSSLIRLIVQEEQAIRERVGNIGSMQESSIRFSLLIGVSAYLAQDETKLKQSEFREFVIRLLEDVTVVPNLLISEESLKQAYLLCKDIDEKDTIYVALVIEFGFTLITNDKKLYNSLKEQKLRQIILLEEVLAMLITEECP